MPTGPAPPCSPAHRLVATTRIGDPALLAIASLQPARPPMLPTLLAVALLVLSSATAIMISLRIWREHVHGRALATATPAPAPGHD